MRRPFGWIFLKASGEEFNDLSHFGTCQFARRENNKVANVHISASTEKREKSRGESSSFLMIFCLARQCTLDYHLPFSQIGDRTISVAPPYVRTILIAEDDAAIRAILQHSATLAGYEVIVAADGNEALTRNDAHDGAIDLLIADLQMPNLGGIELARQLRLRKPDLPIVFMSANSGQGLSPSDEEFPDHLYFRKPFVPSDLLAAVAQKFPPAGPR